MLIGHEHYVASQLLYQMSNWVELRRSEAVLEGSSKSFILFQESKLLKQYYAPSHSTIETRI